jgi:diguanylate cyclase
MDKNYDFRIMIIDDNPDIHRDFIKTLTSFNTADELKSLDEKLFGSSSEPTKDDKPAEIPLPKFQIDTATQGKEGVEQILTAIKNGTPYALAFVDIRMPPGWDGIETIKHIWELDKDIQIVICTAYSDYTWEETIAELGQTDNLLILKKPFDHIAVRQLACALTRKWKLMQDSRSYTQMLENTVQKRTEELQHQATHDSLTGLLNRVLLEEGIKKAIAESQRNNTHLAIFFFDLDRFKLINDSLSHAAGDELLQVIAKRLQSHIRASNTLARIGGDEFVLVIRDLQKPEQAASIASNLLNIINQPLTINEHNIDISSSIGISIYPKDGTKTDELIRNADTAMYRAKELGGNQFHFYTSEMNKKHMEAIELESELRQALSNNEFFLTYQPQLDLKTNKVTAVEVLLRWNHPTKGILLPIHFMPLAEETGLAVPIGEWVLRKACQQNKTWQKNGLLPIRVAVNVTTKQLRHFNFVETLKAILQETQLDPQYLELELTENTIINNKGVMQVINALKELGVRIAVDDFGTGYSNLNHLRNIPLDRIKIDRSFVQNILIDHGNEVVIQAILAMARGLNLEVLAEGVETQKQLDFLKSQKCDDIQGIYFNHSLSESELTELLKNEFNVKKLLKTE